MVNWSYFNKFEKINSKYLPGRGEGGTMATQAVTAVNKLVYKWYNDGDVYDNTKYLEGWANDLSSYANWLAKYAGCADILDQIYEAYDSDDYEEILKELADYVLDAYRLAELNENPVEDSIYECEGEYHFVDWEEEEEEEDEWEDDWDEEDDEDEDEDDE